MRLPDFVTDQWRRALRDARAVFVPLDAVALAALLGVAAVPRDWPLPAPAGGQDGADVVTRVAAAEAAFNREVAAKGVQEGFLTFVADSGVILAPGGIVTRAMMQSAPKQPGGGSLIWHPTWVEASRDGDLAVSTGPFESRRPGAPGVAHGQFLTVWTRLPDGSYRYLMDGGIEHGTPTPEMPTVASAIAGTPAAGELVASAGGAGAASSEPADALEAARAAVLASDSAYAAHAATDWKAAAAAAHASDVRLLRTGRFPIVGSGAAADSIAAWRHALPTQRKAVFTSRAADLAVVRGIYTLPGATADAPPAERGHVVRVWRRTPDRRWKIALEELLPFPPRGAPAARGDTTDARPASAAPAPGTAPASASSGTTAPTAGDALPIVPLDDAPPASVELTGRAVELPLVAGVGPRAVIEARVNGQGPFRFLVETGARFVAITPALAERLAVKPVGRGGGETDSPVVRLSTVGLGEGAAGATLRELHAAVLPLPVPGVDGLLGLSTFHDLLLTLDYPARTVRLARGTLAAPNGRDVLAVQRAGPLLSIDLDVAGRRGRALLDTQSDGGFTVNARTVTSLRTVGAPAVVGRATGPTVGDIERRVARLDGDVRLGGVTFERPVVELLPLPSVLEEEFILGARVLQRFVLTLDQRTMALRLTPRDGATRVPPASGVRSLGFTAARRGTDAVRRVTWVAADSDAGRAGLRVGDEIVAANGAPSATYDVEAWRALADRVEPTTFRVRSGGAERDVAIASRVVVE